VSHHIPNLHHPNRETHPLTEQSNFPKPLVTAPESEAKEGVLNINLLEYLSSCKILTLATHSFFQVNKTGTWRSLAFVL
jgi:hypothetical protein